MFERGKCEKLKFNKEIPTQRSRTHQSFAKDADINNIMNKYSKTGVLVDPTLINSKRQPRFGDFSDIADYATIVNRINQANDDFMTLPAVTRDKFNNNVEECLRFIADPNNVKECVTLGLLPASVLPPSPKPNYPVTPPAEPVVTPNKA